jgi:hypothetical protein
MTQVRRHQRVTRGRAVTVRAHERSVPASRGSDTVWDDGTWNDSSSGDSYWDEEQGCWTEPGGLPADVQQALDGMKDEMREWRSRPVPSLPPEPMSPQMAKLLGCDTPEGRERFERLRAYRESGYHGPLDQDSNIPDPDDPDEQDALEALAYMRANT